VLAAVLPVLPATVLAAALATALATAGPVAPPPLPGAAGAAAPPLRGAAPRPADAPLALVPGIAFGWTDAGTEALLSFQLQPGPVDLQSVTNVRLPAKHVALAGYRFEPAAGRLLLRVRADRAGDVPLRKLELELRYAPAQTLRLRAAEVIALPGGGGPLRLAGWASDDAVGLYAAFALRNAGPVPVTVHALRYAPPRLGNGLVLEETGPPSAFQAWKDRVLERMEPAFGAYLMAGGHDPLSPSRALAPGTLAFPLGGALAGAHWRASGALDVTVAPGEALFLAVTPAAFSTYVDDLAITAYPVIAYHAADGCCRLQGVAAPIVHVVAVPAGRAGRER